MTTEQKELVNKEKNDARINESWINSGSSYQPNADIVETEKEVHLYLDMPGVNKDGIDLKLDKNTLEVVGKIDTAGFDGLKPVYREYRVGNYVRRFQLSNEIDQTAIAAQLNDGVLTITLPKSPEQQPKTIKVA